MDTTIKDQVREMVTKGVFETQWANVMIDAAKAIDRCLGTKLYPNEFHKQISREQKIKIFTNIITAAIAKKYQSIPESDRFATFIDEVTNPEFLEARDNPLVSFQKPERRVCEWLVRYLSYAINRTGVPAAIADGKTMQEIELHLLKTVTYEGIDERNMRIFGLPPEAAAHLTELNKTYRFSELPITEVSDSVALRVTTSPQRNLASMPNNSVISDPITAERKQQARFPIRRDQFSAEEIEKLHEIRAMIVQEFRGFTKQTQLPWSYSGRSDSASYNAVVTSRITKGSDGKVTLVIEAGTPNQYNEKVRLEDKASWMGATFYLAGQLVGQTCKRRAVWRTHNVSYGGATLEFASLDILFQALNQMQVDRAPAPTAETENPTATTPAAEQAQAKARK